MLAVQTDIDSLSLSLWCARALQTQQLDNYKQSTDLILYFVSQNCLVGPFAIIAGEINRG